MDWFFLNLGDGVKAYQLSQRIMEAFGPAFIAAGSPDDMAVFSRYDGKPNAVIVYFTPSAANLARVFNAQPCNKPQIGTGVRVEDFGLLVGPADALDIHFPSLKL